jgi:hypothetical protein
MKKLVSEIKSESKCNEKKSIVFENVMIFQKK